MITYFVIGKTYRACADMARPLLVTSSNMELLDGLRTTGPHAHTHIVFDEFNYSTAGARNSALTAEEVH